MNTPSIRRISVPPPSSPPPPLHEWRRRDAGSGPELAFLRSASALLLSDSASVLVLPKPLCSFARYRSSEAAGAPCDATRSLTRRVWCGENPRQSTMRAERTGSDPRPQIRKIDPAEPRRRERRRDRRRGPRLPGRPGAFPVAGAREPSTSSSSLECLVAALSTSSALDISRLEIAGAAYCHPPALSCPPPSTAPRPTQRST